MKRWIARWIFAIVALGTLGMGTSIADAPPVSAPPDSFFQLVNDRDRDAARGFYKKYLDVAGMPVAASSEVADEALQRTHWLVTHLLAGRPDVLQAMVSNRMYLIVIGKDQVYTDMPEYRHAPNPEYLNERVRGTGGRPTSFGEENLLSLPLDRYDDESIALHEFCHTIDGTLRAIEPTWTERRNKVYHDAVDKGLWKNTYAASNPGEFWAEICQSYFDCNRTNNWNHGPIGKREELKAYDPESYELAQSTFNLSGANDFRYSWLRKLPNIIPPPAKFHIDPYYTKFTWAREFTIVGRRATDEAMLKANITVRKMFAYRHDILKALINDGLKLVVLGKDEKLSDLPALRVPPDYVLRWGYFSKDKLLVAEEEDLGETVRVLATAFYQVCANRPVDPNWDKRGRDVQQYELRVQRLDARWGEKVKEACYGTKDKSLWPPVVSEPALADCFADGVEAYFDGDAHRNYLQKYHPKTFALVKETMAYEGHPDWRYRP